jgi:hypothetical protein
MVSLFIQLTSNFHTVYTTLFQIILSINFLLTLICSIMHFTLLYWLTCIILLYSLHLIISHVNQSLWKFHKTCTNIFQTLLSIHIFLTLPHLALHVTLLYNIHFSMQASTSEMWTGLQAQNMLLWWQRTHTKNFIQFWPLLIVSKNTVNHLFVRARANQSHSGLAPSQHCGPLMTKHPLSKNHTILTKFCQCYIGTRRKY